MADHSPNAPLKKIKSKTVSRKKKIKKRKHVEVTAMNQNGEVPTQKKRKLHVNGNGIESKIHSLYESNRILKVQRDHYKKGMNVYKDAMNEYKEKYQKLRQKVFDFYKQSIENDKKNMKNPQNGKIDFMQETTMKKEEEEEKETEEGQIFDVSDNESSIEILNDTHSNSINNRSLTKKRRMNANADKQRSDTMYDGVVSALVEMGIDFDRISSALSPYFGTKTPPNIVQKELIDALTTPQKLSKCNKKRKKRPRIELIPNEENATWNNTQFVDVECHLCNERFYDAEQYMDHLEVCYPTHGLTWLQCEFRNCGHTSKEKAKFCYHISTHTKKGLYHCNVMIGSKKCNVIKKNKYLIRDHVNSHYGKKVIRLSAPSLLPKKSRNNT